MKINVSYINSIYDYQKTIDLICSSNADGVHADLMDGVYAGKLNYKDETLLYLKNKKIFKEFHLMVDKPEEIITKIIELNPSCVYIHPSTTKNIDYIFKMLEKNKIEKGIVINPDENINNFLPLFSKVERVLLMSVIPGAGGQKFIMDTTSRLEKLINYKKMYGFLIYVDGGINPSTIKNVACADGVIVGSFICTSNDYKKNIDMLKICLNK